MGSAYKLYNTYADSRMSETEKVRTFVKSIEVEYIKGQLSMQMNNNTAVTLAQVLQKARDCLTDMSV
eukprot:8653049-Ditylum_brightwellii.AAC.1